MPRIGMNIRCGFHPAHDGGDEGIHLLLAVFGGAGRRAADGLRRKLRNPNREFVFRIDGLHVLLEQRDIHSLVSMHSNH